MDWLAPAWLDNADEMDANMAQPREETSTVITIAILAKNEARAIGRLIGGLANQSLLTRGYTIDLLVVANACTDGTELVAEQAMARLSSPCVRATRVHSTPLRGKSRAWNTAVHELAAPDTQIMLFIDADIRLANQTVAEDLIERLSRNTAAVACTGRPTKITALRRNKRIIDKVSLQVSEDSRADRSINGSLYAVRMAAMRDIWLPIPTPGEDGFLNAMVRTRGFSQPDDVTLVTQADQVTHYYEPPKLLAILSHERRMIIGTAVNIWLFEHFMALRPAQSVGPIIEQANRDTPGWVGTIIRRRIGHKAWAVPAQVLWWRFPRPNDQGLVAYCKRLPVGIVASGFNLVACVAANRILRTPKAEEIW